MVTKADEGSIYAWKKLSFPLWHTKRPLFEALDEVNKMLAQHCPYVVRSNYETLKSARNDKEWVDWTFDGPIHERLRLRMQERLFEIFGEFALDFRWEGSRARTEIAEVIAIGPHLQ